MSSRSEDPCSARLSKLEQPSFESLSAAGQVISNILVPDGAEHSMDQIVRALIVCTCSQDTDWRNLALRAARLIFNDTCRGPSLLEALRTLIAPQPRAVSKMNDSSRSTQLAALEIIARCAGKVEHSVGIRFDIVRDMVNSIIDEDVFIEETLLHMLNDVTMNDLYASWDVFYEIAMTFYRRAAPVAPLGSNEEIVANCRHKPLRLAEKLALLYLRSSCSSPSRTHPVHVLSAREQIVSSLSVRMVCRQLGGLVDYYATFLSDETALRVLHTRASTVDSSTASVEWVEKLQSITRFYYTREHRLNIRLQTLQHLRAFLFDQSGFDRNVIVTEVLEHIIPHVHDTADDQVPAVQAKIMLLADAVADEDLFLNEQVIIRMLSSLKESACRKGCISAESLTAVQGLHKIIQNRLPGRPSWIARKAIYILYSAFLQSPHSDAVQAAADVLTRITASNESYIVLYPQQDCALENDPSSSSRASPEYEDSDDEVSAHRRTLIGRKLERVKGEEVHAKFLRVRSPSDLSPIISDDVDPNCRTIDDNPDGLSLFSAEYFMRGIANALTGDYNRCPEEDLAIARSLRSAVVNVNMNQIGCNDYLAATLVTILAGNIGHEQLRRRVQSNVELRLILQTTLQALVCFIPSRLPRLTWEALLPVRGCSASLCDAAAIISLLKNVVPSSYIRNLFAMCLDIIRDIRSRPVTVKICDSFGDQYEKEVGAQADDLDISAMELIRLVLSIEKSEARALEALTAVLRGITLGAKPIILENGLPFEISLTGNPRFRWVSLCRVVFCTAIERVSSSARARARADLAAMAKERNFTAAVLYEHCLCDHAALDTVPHSYLLLPTDHSFAVHAQPLPYLVSARVLARGDVLVCQRRATSSTVDRMCMQARFSRNIGSRDRNFPSTGIYLNHRSRESTAVEQVLSLNSMLYESIPSIRQLNNSENAIVAEAVNASGVLAPTSATGIGCTDIRWKEVVRTFLERTGSGGGNRLCELENVQEHHFKVLDDTYIDITHKFGLVYVPTGAIDDEEILLCKPTSLAWLRFLSDLGDFIPVQRPALMGAETHSSPVRGNHVDCVEISRQDSYRGGLYDSDSTYFLSYIEPVTQVVFHVPELITPDHSSELVDQSHAIESKERREETLFRRKANILNDHVLIVWNESARAYDPSMMRTNFGFIQIIISPTVSPRFFHVKVFSRVDGLSDFGPLRPCHNSYAVPVEELGSAVRLTAIHADLLLHAQEDGFCSTGPSCDLRAAVIKKIVEGGAKTSDAAIIHSEPE